MDGKSSRLSVELQELLLVALGAVPGALLRWLLSMHFDDQNLSANTIGAALLGFLKGLPGEPRRQLLLGIGFCGSITTFSSWMFDSVRFIANGEFGMAIGLIALTLGFGLGSAALGVMLGRRIGRSLG